jgi:hypothetical protein
MAGKGCIIIDDPLNPKEGMSDAQVAKMIDWWKEFCDRRSRGEDAADVPLIVGAPPDANH